ncbi:MAG TPA: BtuF-related (seleno)protein, partial [Candidatus Binatus sp.]|nr:BtuF-related (seleno)protein [Candidatus Binatus sp.]
MRICSLLPGATEIVFALGLGDDLVGVTHECDYPADAKQKPLLVHSA